MEKSPAKTKTTAIYGGSFNPIHTGHTQLAQWLVDQGYADELWFLVSPLNPLKQEASSTLLPDDVRLRLAQLAVPQSRRSPLRVSDFELSQPRPSYMAHTLEALRRRYPRRHFVLLIGADNWLTFDRWYQPDDILAHHPILVYPREGYPIDPTQLPPTVTLLPDAPLFPTSSTAIRTAIHEGRCQGEWLHARVWEEIQRMGYYL